MHWCSRTGRGHCDRRPSPESVFFEKDLYRTEGSDERPLLEIIDCLERPTWGAKPTGQFALPEWRISAKADACITDAECLELVGS